MLQGWKTQVSSWYRKKRIREPWDAVDGNVLTHLQMGLIAVLLCPNLVERFLRLINFHTNATILLFFFFLPRSLHKDYEAFRNFSGTLLRDIVGNKMLWFLLSSCLESRGAARWNYRHNFYTRIASVRKYTPTNTFFSIFSTWLTFFPLYIMIPNFKTQVLKMGQALSMWTGGWGGISTCFLPILPCSPDVFYSVE